MTKMRHCSACLAACLLPIAVSAQAATPTGRSASSCPSAPRRRHGYQRPRDRGGAVEAARPAGDRREQGGRVGNIGTQGVAAHADGYTLVLASTGTLVINPHVFASIPFDTVKDLAPGRQDR